MPGFEPTREAALQRLGAVDPDAYARTRNALGGAVTRLSPYITHGLLGLREVYKTVHQRHPMDVRHKFVFELGWRAYWRHVWEQRGDGVHQSLHAGPLPDAAYDTTIPRDVLEARTGIPAIDRAVQELVTTGYLHNHARMWLASYLVHLRKVHWHTGAQWMLGHLLDGDIASNHLSWQWVAGTGSSKPYLFNAENVAKYAPPQWHSGGSAIDTTYEALDAMARDASVRLAPSPVATAPGLNPLPLFLDPRDACGSSSPWRTPDATDALTVQGQDVWLLHPWAIHADASLLPVGAVGIGVGLDACHARTPWSARRWDFVTRGLQARANRLWWGNSATLAEALQGARSVQWQADLHVDHGMAALQRQLHARNSAVRMAAHNPPVLFTPVERPCRSFSNWWTRTHLAQYPQGALAHDENPTIQATPKRPYHAHP